MASLVLTDNLGEPIVTNETYNLPKFKTGWANTGKGNTQWNSDKTVIGTIFIKDNQGNLITDNSGNDLVTNTTANVKKSNTEWIQTGN